MILDSLENAEFYYGMHPGFKAAFEYLRKTDLTALPAGKNEVDGDRMYLMMNRGKGQGKTKAKLEVHRANIDIQLGVSGTDEIGWKAIRECSQVVTEFDAANDFALYSDAPNAWVAVPPGKFAIFFPGDAHAPMTTESDLVKAVMKVAVDWK